MLFFAAPADASVSFTVPMDALVEESSAACVVSPTFATSVWENGRIATYTRAHVDRVLAGSASNEVWIKTLGGAVGDVGQNVDGEAVLRPGRQSVVFSPCGLIDITATSRNLWGMAGTCLIGAIARNDVVTFGGGRLSHAV